MSRTFDIACLQTRPMPGFDDALAEALPLADSAVNAGAEFLALPEYCGGLRSDGPRLVPPVASEKAHPVLAGLRNFAAKRGVWILVGSVAVTGPRGKFYNRSLLVDRNGDIVARYDKIHLFDIQLSETEVFRESASVMPGAQAQVVETEFGRIGLSICYDLRFSQLYRDMAQQGADILMIPAAFTKKTGQAHWHVLNRCRAIENGAFVVAPCAIGPIDGGGESYGHSLVVNPWGEVIADGQDLPGMVMSQINMDQVAEARGRIPSLDHDRDFTLLVGTDNEKVVA